MADPANPIGNIFDRFLSKPTNIDDYLDRLGIVESTGLSYSLSKIDKHNILGRALPIYSNNKVYSIGDAISKRTGMNAALSRVVSPGDAPLDPIFDAPEELGSLLSRISSKFDLKLAGKGNEMYLVADGAQIPLPVQNLKGKALDAGIVQIGQTRRGAYKFIQLGHDGELTYSQIYYRKLKALADSTKSRARFLREAEKIPDLVIGRGIKGKIRFRTLLGSPVSMRGELSHEFNAAAYAMKARIGIGKDEFSREVAARFDRLKQAHRIIRTISKSKSADLFRRKDTGITLVNSKQTTMEMMDISNREIESFNSWLPTLYDKLGISGMHPMAKPDFLIGEKGLVLPTKLARAIYGNTFSLREQQKGLFQFYNQSRLTIEQMNIASRLGVASGPSFITKGEHANVGTRDILRRRTGKVAIIGFDNPLAEALFTGDSGAYLTPLGESTFASTRNLASIKLNKTNRYTLRALEILGLDPRGPSESIETITQSDINIARNFGDNTFMTDGSRRWALRQLMKDSGRNSGIFDSIYDLNNENLKFSTSIYKGDLRLNISTAERKQAKTAEVLVGLTRQTAQALDPSSPLYPLAKQLASQGVEVIAGASQRERFGPNFEVSNFLGVMEKEGRLEEAVRVLGIKSSVDVNLPGLHKPQSIKLIDDYESATKAIHGYIRDLAKSRDRAKLALAKSIKRGLDVTENVQGIPNLVKTVHTVFADLSMRADARMDMNMSKRYKLTAGKVKTLAQHSMLLGYSDVNQDPLFKNLTHSYGNRGIRFGKNLDFDFDPSTNFYKYFKALSDKSFVPASNILTFGKDGFRVDGELLKDLPEIGQFGMSKGGVTTDLLKDTLLDKKFRDKLLFIDMGEKGAVKLHSAISNSQRYVPLPMFLARTGLKDSRMAIGKTHPFRGMLEALQELRQSGNTHNFRKLALHGTERTVEKIVGKKGLLNKSTTIHVAQSFSARLVPQSGNMLSSVDDMFNPDRIFEASISRKALSVEMLKKRGYHPESIDRIQKMIKEKDFMYVMLGADPAQRGEHIGNVFKLNFTNEAYSGGGLSINISSLAESLFERDRDMDNIKGILLEGRMDQSPQTIKLLEERIAKQKALLAPILPYLRAEMSMSGGKAKKAVSNVMASYIGQKSWASYGYTIARPVERILPILAEEGVEGLERLGVRVGGKLDAEHIKLIQSVFQGRPDLQGAAYALNQTLFQGGVDKGVGKGSLQEVGKFLASLAEDTRVSQVINMPSVLNRSQEVFENFLRAQKKQRLFQAAGVILGDMGNLSSHPLLSGLEAGASMNQEQIISRMAKVMSITLGATAAIAPLVGSVKNINSIMEDSYVPDNESGMQKFMNAFFKQPTTKAQKAETEQFAESVIRSTLISDISSNNTFKESLIGKAKEIAESKWILPALGIGAVAAAYGYMNRPTDVARPVDASRPTDLGPQIPDMTDVPTIYTSKQIPRSSRLRKPTQFNSVSTSFSNRNDTRVTVEDKVSPMNPWLVRQQMDRVSNSDFVY